MDVQCNLELTSITSLINWFRIVRRDSFSSRPPTLGDLSGGVLRTRLGPPSGIRMCIGRTKFVYVP